LWSPWTQGMPFPTTKPSTTPNIAGGQQLLFPGDAASSDAQTAGGTTPHSLSCEHGEDVGIITNVNSPATATMVAVGIACSGFQAGSPTVATITAANFSSDLVGPLTVAQPSFTLGTMAARRGAPSFFRDAGGPQFAPSTTNEETTTATCLFGRVAAVDHRPASAVACGAPPREEASSSEHQTPATTSGRCESASGFVSSSTPGEGLAHSWVVQ
jgi:hypothetical protein